MVELLKGTPVAEALNAQISQSVMVLKERGIIPTLAILRVGERPDDVAYENGAVKRCEKVGVRVRKIVLPESATQEELTLIIKNFNDDCGVHGVLMFRPLPKHLDEAALCNTLAPEKDVDGITNISMSGVFSGVALGYPPCTPQACIEMLDYYGIELKGKRVVVIGRSLVVGKPLAMLLMARHATVTVCHTRTLDMPSVTRGADIIIAAAGKAGAVDARHLSPGQVVIDVGINWDEEAGKIVGDVKTAEAEAIVRAITPVPGGVGTVTTSVLVKHVIDAAARSDAK